MPLLEAGPPNRQLILRRLAAVRWVAVVDAALLVPLVIAAVRGAEGAVDVLGPLHGVGFLLLLFLVARGASEQLWGWWFPVLVTVTLGPPGSLIGDLRVRRDLRPEAGRERASAGWGAR